MLAPGISFNGTQVMVTAGAATTAAVINGGYGFMANGSLALDTDAPAGNSYAGFGIRLNTTGALYATLTSDPSDVICGGLRVTQTGALVYEVAAATHIEQGNPMTANDRFAVV
jgi:hypothetical protein